MVQNPRRNDRDPIAAKLKYIERYVACSFNPDSQTAFRNLQKALKPKTTESFLRLNHLVPYYGKRVKDGEPNPQDFRD